MGKKRGFAAMSPEARRKIAASGGRKAHLEGVAHKFSPEEAFHAGRKGGQSTLKRFGHDFFARISASAKEKRVEDAEGG